jgi:flagellar basal body rod protein FlgG
MNYGMQISASGVLTAMYEQDVATNNLANVNTVGFKPEVTSLIARDAARIEDGVMNLPSNVLLERLGAGVLVAPNAVSFEQGPLVSTSNDLDLAIQGEGFFVIRESTDQTGDRFRLSRDGRLTRDPSGQLVRSADGLPVLDVQNRPINLPIGPVFISSDGTISQDDKVLAQIQVTQVPDNSRLRKIGHGMFQAPADAMEGRRPATGLVRQFNLESAAVDPVLATVQVTQASRDAERNFGMIQYHDRLIDRAINTLGRVA